MIEALRNAWSLPDLRRRILITVAILAIYRLCAHIPAPGVDRTVVQAFLDQGQQGGLFGVIDLLSGGAVSNFSVLAMGVYPYITASIILQLLIPIIPALERLQKEEGERGRQLLNQYQYYLTIPLALLQAVGQANLFEQQAASLGDILPHFGLGATDILPTITLLASMTAGTMLAIWLGQLITESGIGQGVSIIILGGIVSRMPANLYQLAIGPLDLAGRVLSVAAFLGILIVTVAGIVYVQEGVRRIPVHYAKRVRGRKVYQGTSTYIPLKINTAGMIPLIFAQSLLTFPAIIAQFFTSSSNTTVVNIANTIINSTTPKYDIYWPIYFIMVVGFTYFYTDVMVQQQDLPGNLQKQGGFIPGIRPGARTAQYVNGVMRRITLVGALFLGAVAILPWPVERVLQTQSLLISSAGVLIVVGVVVDTMRQLEAQLLMRHYEGFIK
jgi:preprotein translocase subunit SecY